LDFLSEQGRGGESTSDSRDAHAGGPSNDAVIVGLEDEAALDAEEVFDALRGLVMATRESGRSLGRSSVAVGPRPTEESRSTLSKGRRCPATLARSLACS
jgi:hypothetical protein